MKKILLIDDDALVLRTIRKLLEKTGYSVQTACNAVDAISLCAVTNFDVVISDIRMPGDNGIVAIKKIKSIYREKGVLCGYLLITGYAEEDTPAHAIRLGINKFIFKPFDNDELLSSVQQELDLIEKEKQLRGSKVFEVLRINKKSKKILHELKRVVITGIGCIAPNGIGKDEYWAGLREGRNCVGKITLFDASNHPSKVASEATGFDPKQFVDDAQQLKRMGRSAHLAVAASKLALKDAGLNPSHNGETIHIILGSATSGIDYAEPEIRALERGGVRKVRPYAGIAGFGGAISGEISRAVGANGTCITISNGCTSATDAFGYALTQLRYGLADTIIAGGADACVTSAITAAFCQMGAISTRNDVTASRPFNIDRDGFVIAEGGWIFILETLEHAAQRNAHIYGELVGYGATCDGWHMSKPHPSGDYTAKAIQLALGDGGINPDEVDLFEAYGNATPVNDSYETAIVKRVFGKHAYDMAVPSVKSMLGHPIGAAGGQQLAAALMAINTSFIHPTINYEAPDPECDLDCVPNKGREAQVRVAVCNSLAFGGKNSCIVVKNCER